MERYPDAKLVASNLIQASGNRHSIKVDGKVYTDGEVYAADNLPQQFFNPGIPNWRCNRQMTGGSDNPNFMLIYDEGYVHPVDEKGDGCSLL